jgi:Aldo/keto reductase family
MPTATSVRAMCSSSCSSTSAATSTTGIPRSSTHSRRIDGWSRSTTSASPERRAGRRTRLRRWPTTRFRSSKHWTFSRSICSASRLAASSRKRLRSSARSCCGVSCWRPQHHRVLLGYTAGRRRSFAQSEGRKRVRRGTSLSSLPLRTRVARQAGKRQRASSEEAQGTETNRRRGRPVRRSTTPPARGVFLSGDTVNAIALRHGRTPAQVLLRWCIQCDIPVIPKSTHRERMAENSQVFDFALSDEEMAQLDELDRTGAPIARSSGLVVRRRG